jgi:ribosomal-protein-alanine N-acetyltransferase
MLEVNFNPFPVLSTKRLTLRRLTLNDAPTLFIFRSSEDIMKYIARPRAKSVQDAIELIQRIDTTIDNNEGINWGIILKETNELIGTIGFVRMKKENFRGEIGYMLNTKYHRLGYMNEAMKAVLDYGFNEIKFHSVEAIIDPANIASMSILEKNNFIREAHFKEDFYFEGQFLDSMVYSLLSGRHIS